MQHVRAHIIWLRPLQQCCGSKEDNWTQWSPWCHRQNNAVTLKKWSATRYANYNGKVIKISEVHLQKNIVKNRRLQARSGRKCRARATFDEPLLDRRTINMRINFRSACRPGVERSGRGRVTRHASLLDRHLTTCDDICMSFHTQARSGRRYQAQATRRAPSRWPT